MVKLIIMAKFITVRPTIVNLTMVKLFIIAVRWFFLYPPPHVYKNFFMSNTLLCFVAHFSAPFPGLAPLPIFSLHNKKKNNNK
jgi:hypothetical protein